MGDFIEQFGTVYLVFLFLDIFLISLNIAIYEEPETTEWGYKRTKSDLVINSIISALIPLINIILAAILMYNIIITNKEAE